MKSKPTFILLLLVSGNISKDRQECHPTSGEVPVLGCPGGSSCLRASREKRHGSQACDGWRGISCRFKGADPDRILCDRKTCRKEKWTL